MKSGLASPCWCQRTGHQLIAVFSLLKTDAGGLVAIVTLPIVPRALRTLSKVSRGRRRTLSPSSIGLGAKRRFRLSPIAVNLGLCRTSAALFRNGTFAF
jgi:hypothetical protein